MTMLADREVVVFRDSDDDVVHVRIGYTDGSDGPLRFTSDQWLMFVKEVSDLMGFMNLRSEQ